jgi:transcription initiation factor TFIIB
VVEERVSDFQRFPVVIERSTPLCVVTPDFRKKFVFDEEIPEDPFDLADCRSFITAFSQMEIEPTVCFTATARSISGRLNDLEKFLGEQRRAAEMKGASTTISDEDLVAAYFLCREAANMLQLEPKYADMALEKIGTTGTLHVSDFGIEVVCAAMFYLACGAGPTSDSPVSIAQIVEVIPASIDQGRVTELLELMERMSSAALTTAALSGMSSAALTTAALSGPDSSRVEKDEQMSQMPRLCKELELPEEVEKLASHIQDSVLKMALFQRRNPASISAASIYMACMLEEKKKTQTEICRATQVTEVTLRKSYKEIEKEIQSRGATLLPPGYVPLKERPESLSHAGFHRPMRSSAPSHAAKCSVQRSPATPHSMKTVHLHEDHDDERAEHYSSGDEHCLAEQQVGQPQPMQSSSGWDHRMHPDARNTLQHDSYHSWSSHDQALHYDPRHSEIPTRLMAGMSTNFLHSDNLPINGVFKRCKTVIE